MFSLPLYVVRGQSMTPNFEPGDALVIARSRKVSRGDVVVTRDHEGTGAWRLKRVIGLPGEGVRQELGALYVNGRRLVEDYLGGLPAVVGLDEAEWSLGDNETFLMGDNRARSVDSREFGAVCVDRIVGVARFRCWPPRRIGRIRRPRYTAGEASA